MTVGQLIEKLKEYPKDMPVAVFGDINYKSKDDENDIQVTKRIWEHTNYPYDQESFEYVDLW